MNFYFNVLKTGNVFTLCCFRGQEATTNRLIISLTVARVGYYRIVILSVSVTFLFRHKYISWYYYVNKTHKRRINIVLLMRCPLLRNKKACPQGVNMNHYQVIWTFA